MPRIVNCPHCQHEFQTSREQEGREIRCPACATPFSPLPDFSLESAITSEPQVALSRAVPVTEGAELEELLEVIPCDPAHDFARVSAADPGVEDMGAKQHSRRQNTVILGIALTLGVVVTVAGIAVVALVFMAANSGNSRPGDKGVPKAHDEAWRKELNEAFHDQNAPDPELSREVLAFFEEISKASRVKNHGGVMASFDLKRMLDELIALELLPQKMVRDKDAFVRGMDTGMRQAQAKQGELFRWHKSEIKYIKRLAPDEIVVIARHEMPDGVIGKIRWWLVKRPGGWKIYDMEDLDLGMRVCIIVGSVVQGTDARSREILSASSDLLEALRAVAFEDDKAKAAKKLKGIEKKVLPKNLDALRFLAVGLLRFQEANYQEALQAFDKARALQPDMLGSYLFRGMTNNQLGNWQKALEDLQEYQRLLGDEALVCGQLAIALRGVGRFPEACTAYRTVLDLEPKNAEAFVGLIDSSTANDKADDLGERFAKLDDPRQHFDECAKHCQEMQAGAALEQIALVIRKLDPDNVSALYSLCLAHAWNGKGEQASVMYREALSKQKDEDKRKEYVIGFLQAMANGGQAVIAYGAALDSKEAFRYLAEELKKSYRQDELKKLVQLHAKKCPDDALLPFYQGDIYVREGNYPLADRSFLAGMAAAPDQAVAAAFRGNRVTARYHVGQALSAYDEIKPRDETFKQLANLLLADRKFADLETLIQAHAKNQPTDREITLCRLRMKVRQGQTNDGIALFKDMLKKEVAEEVLAGIVSDFLDEMRTAGKTIEGYQAVPDAKQAFRDLAEQLVEDDDLAELHRLVDAHRRKQPDDVWLYYYSGSIHQSEQAWDQAAQAFGEGLRKAPADVKSSFHWGYVNAMYKAGRPLGDFWQTEPRQETFTQLAGLLEADKKGSELQALVDAHRSRAGGQPEFVFHEARARSLSKRLDQALPLYLEAYRKQPALHSRRHYIDTMIRDFHEAGSGLSAYRAAPDKDRAFEALADMLVLEKKEQDLEKLLDEHGTRHAKEVEFRYQKGQLFSLRGHFDQAALEFASVLSQVQVNNQWKYRNALYRARIQSGKTAATYREFAMQNGIFENLANQCLALENPSQLEALIDVHRKAEPDDSSLFSWEIEVRWLNKDYPAVARLLREHRNEADLTRFQWKISGYLIRSLVRSKRFDEAINEAEKLMERPYENPVLLVLAYAARGEVKEAIAVMERHRSKRYLSASCYRDEDLGRILRSEPFREFRERFPEPEMKDDED